MNSRKGQYWSADEEKQLLLEMEQRMPLQSIARAHGRSERAIELRFLMYVQNNIRDGKSTLSVIAKRFGRDVQELEDKLNELSLSTNTTKEDNIQNELRQINTRLEKIEKILYILFSKKNKTK